MTNSIVDKKASLRRSSNRAAAAAQQKELGVIEKFLAHTVMQVLMAVLILIGLFAADMNQLLGDSTTDEAFNYIITVVFALFMVEWFLQTCFVVGYFNSFYFWIDLLGSLSLIFDIGWIRDEIFGSEPKNAIHQGTVLRIGRAARAGAQMTRWLRLTRMTRLFRVVRQWMHLTDKEVEESEPSYIGRKYAESMSQKVVFGLIIIFLVMPLLTFSEADLSTQASLDMLDSIAGTRDDRVIQFGVEQFLDPVYNGDDVLYLSVRGVVYRDVDPNTRLLRANELNFFNSQSGVSGFNSVIDDVGFSPAEFPVVDMHEGFNGAFDTNAVVDRSKQLDDMALSQIVAILFNIFFIFVASTVLNKDASDMVIYPIERMVTVVRKLASNLRSLSSEMGINDDMETHFLETSINKMANLLLIGLGKESTSILGEAIIQPPPPSVLGSRVRAVFAFCDCRVREDQGDLNVFEAVDDLQKVVSSMFENFGGQPDKHVGQSFLTLWNLNAGGSSHQRVARDTLHSVMIIIDTIHTESFTDDKELLNRLQSGNIALGFGLHVGWATEGASKIEASFLSNETATAANLEQLTTEYDVPVVLSERFVEVLPNESKIKCRRLDRIQINSPGAAPLVLYTLSPDFYFDDATPINWVDLHYHYEKGLDHYILGNWDWAKDSFKKCLEIHPNDGPTKFMIKYMKENKKSRWKGARPVSAADMKQ